VLHAAAAPLTAFVVALILVWCLSRGRLAQMVVDRPNDRSLHSTPVPRSGGLGLHAGVLLAWPIAGAGIPTIILFALMALLAVSAWDDMRGLPVMARLAAQLLAGGAVSTCLLLPDFGLVMVFISTLGIVWMTNLYNFMDGADGLAGGMTLFGFTFYGVAAYLAGSTAFAFLNLSIAAAAAAFLLFNFHPARIFLGDAGSVPLGFLAACFGLVGGLQNIWPWWFPLLVFSPFVVDASVTLAKRACARAAVWQAHRDHYYQRLVRLGWGHRRTALAEYALMFLCGAAALAGLGWPKPGQWVLLTTAAALYGALIIAVDIAWRKARRVQQPEV
jgi:UDP-N-acetylmuramyl pentapeptide phosphotransferase/UDP-N-acetylglucosamine-1-phosphate transferase